MVEDITGLSMDKAITPKRGKSIKYWLAGLALSSLLIVALERTGNEATLEIDNSKLNIATVSQGTFEHYIPIIVLSQAKHIQPIDVRASGRVKKIHFRSGDRVEKDQILIELDNFEHEMEVARKHSDVIGSRGQLQDKRINEEINVMKQQTDMAQSEMTFNKM